MAQERRRQSPPTDELAASRVLIADDQSAIRENLSKLFVAEGFEVTCAANIDGALGALRKNGGEFDLIILDVRMPEKATGDVREDAGVVAAGFVRRFCEIAPETIIVVFTAYPNVADCFASIDSHAYYLPKTLPDQNVTRDLVAECARRVAQAKEAVQRTSRTWLGQYYKKLTELYGGKTVAVMDESKAKANKVKSGRRIGECRVLANKDPKALRERILRTPALRRSLPVLIDIMEEI